MDSTLTRAKRTNKHRQERNFKAWQRFSPDGTTCRFCKHDHTTHLCTSRNRISIGQRLGQRGAIPR